jgi:uncharacterized repeat protein (TIGR01451 family)
MEVFMRKFVSLLMCLSMIVLWTGCACMKQAQATPAPAPVVKSEPKPAPAPVAQTGANHVIRDYACPGCGAIRIEKLMPERVQLGQPFDYTIQVTNLTDMLLSDIVVRDSLPAAYKYKSSAPAGKLDGNVLTWSMESLGPKASEKIVVTGSAAEIGWIQTCADATYIIPACAKTQVVQPALEMVKTAPEKVLICQEIPIQFTVTNKGTGTATNVKITDKLAEGLKTADGKGTIDLALGNLAAAQSVSRTVMVRAEKVGSYRNQAMAVGDGNLKAESAVTQTLVMQPVLAIEKTGMKNQYLGRTLSYDIVVANKGDAVADNTMVTDAIPANVRDIKASDNGKVSAGMVTWNLGSLAPGASRKVTVSYTPTVAGAFKNEAKATAGCAAAVVASAVTQVAGIPAVLLEVVDVDDPIEVGKNETYIVTVTNQGSAPDTNVKLKVFLEDTMEFVSAGGATRGGFAEGAVTFEPLPSLAPKAAVSWRVVVKAVKAGDVRLRVTLNTDELGRDVMETEATRFFE